MSGRRFGRGFWPLRSVGATMNWPDDRSACVEQLFVSQPLAAIHVACGATPIWFVPGSPSSPTIVPIVCVPWPLLSHGVPAPHTAEGSHQLQLWLKLPPPRLPRYFATSAPCV